MTKRVLALAMLVAAGVSAMPHRFRLHPSSNLSINGIAPGPEGFLWLATTDGLFRFDGLRYQRIPGCPLVSANAVASTSDGAVWIGGHAGLVRFHQGRFSLVTGEGVNAVAAYGTAVIVSAAGGQRRVSANGEVVVLPGSAGLAPVVTGATVLGLCGSPARVCALIGGERDFSRVAVPPAATGIAVGSEGREVWIASPGVIRGADLQGRAIGEFHHQSASLPLYGGRKGQVWYTADLIQGLSPAVAFAEPPKYRGHPVTAAYEDERGHLWVARRGIGLIEFVEDTDFERWYPPELGGDAPFQILRSNKQELLAVTRGRIYRLDENKRTWVVHAAERHRYEYVLVLENGEFLASTRTAGIVRLSPEGKVLERVPDPTPRTGEFRKMLRDRKGTVWIGHKHGLFRLEGTPGAFRLVRQTLPDEAAEQTNAADLELDAGGKLWVGYGAGLAYLEGSEWRLLPTDVPVSKVRSMALGGDTYWTAHRHAGWFTRLNHGDKVWSTVQFDSAKGFGPRDTHFIKLDSRGWLWRGTAEGVFVSKGIAPGRSYRWLHISEASGLAADGTDMFGFFEDRDGSVWIAGAEGITRLRPDAKWFEAPHGAPPPQVSSYELDGITAIHLPERPPVLFAAQHMRIEFGSLQISPFRDHPFLYRSSPAGTAFQPVGAEGIELRDLNAGDYTLQIAYTEHSERPATHALNLRFGSPSAVSPSLRLWWVVLAAPAAMAFWFALRHKRWMDRIAYWPPKAAFLLKRRFNRSAPSGPRPDYCGQTLAGRYRIDRVLSRGGFATVYMAEDTRNASAAAVKVIRSADLRERPVRNRFVQEIAALQSIQHPGVVPILDWWVSGEGEPCLAMPFLDGPTLRQALDAGPLPRMRAAAILRGLASALAAVHARGIVHRDVKPENVILAAPANQLEQPVLIDFGAAGLRMPTGSSVTTMLAGSFHYIAPERLAGKYSPASDVYSLAVVVLEMLTGRRLADLLTLPAEAGFQAELAAATGCPKIADSLAPAFEPDPARRPADVYEWAVELAGQIGDGAICN